MSEPNSFGNPESLKNLEFINDQLSTTDIGQHQSESQPRSVTELGDAVAGDGKDEESRLSKDDGSRLNKELEQACLATGATGAAIALVRGKEIVCQASTGPHAPDVGVCLDPRTGLSGSCIQTRQIQQCNDTETDPRVNPDACRSLGVRSIVVLPLMDGDVLFGIFEILSSRPNAFGQRDLDSLQAVANRIVESRKQNQGATATEPRKEPVSFPQTVAEVVPHNMSNSPESDARFPRRERISRRNDIKANILGVLVIASALLLGTLVGWRLGWQKATLGFRASSSRHRVNALSRDRRTDPTVFPVKEFQPSSAREDECGQSVAAGSAAQPPTGELTVCQDGRVIFRLPPSGPPPVRNLQTSQRLPVLEAGPRRR